MPNLYSITSREVEPVTDLLKALVEVNWHLKRAGLQGWSVTLSVNDRGNVDAIVTRAAVWPDLSREPEVTA